MNEVTALMSCQLTLSDSPNQYWVIGTEIVTGNASMRNGSILVCVTQADGSIEIIAKHQTTGGVEALALIDGRIIVASGPGVS